MSEFTVIAELYMFEQGNSKKIPDFDCIPYKILRRLMATYNVSDVLKNDAKKRNKSLGLSNIEKSFFKREMLLESSPYDVPKVRINMLSDATYAEKLIVGGYATFEDFVNPEMLFTKKSSDDVMETAINWYLYVITGSEHYLKLVDWNKINDKLFAKIVSVYCENDRILEKEIDRRGIRINDEKLLTLEDDCIRCNNELNFIDLHKSKFQKQSPIEISNIDILSSYNNFNLTEKFIKNVSRIYNIMKTTLNMKYENVLLHGKYLTKFINKHGFLAEIVEISADRVYCVNITSDKIGITTYDLMGSGAEVEMEILYEKYYNDEISSPEYFKKIYYNNIILGK